MEVYYLKCSVIGMGWTEHERAVLGKDIPPTRLLRGWAYQPLSSSRNTGNALSVRNVKQVSREDADTRKLRVFGFLLSFLSLTSYLMEKTR